MTLEFYMGLGYALAIVLGVIIDEMIRQTIKNEERKKEFHEMWLQEQNKSGRNHYKNTNYKNNNKK